MARFLRNKILWFAVYAIGITLVFLYMLFPVEIVQSKLQQAAISTGLRLRTETLKPSFPLGLKFKNIQISSISTARSYVEGEWLDIQVNPLSFFRKNKKIKLGGKAWGGNFSGSMGFASWENIASPLLADIQFKDIDLAQFSFMGDWMARNISGKASGHWSHQVSQSAGRNISATFDLLINRGSFPLKEAFLGATRIDFEKGELKGRLENGVIKMERLRIAGAQLECFLNGDITLADNFRESTLNLKGEIMIPGNKTKMNVTVGGTLANPLLRYI